VLGGRRAHDCDWPGVDRSSAQGRRVHRGERAGKVRQVPRSPDRALRALNVISGDTMAYDLILKGGRVIDPSQNIDRVTDVAFSGGKVAKVGDNLGDATETRDVRATSSRPGCSTCTRMCIGA